MFVKEKHLGHIVFDALISRPDSICQIDASTGEEETNATVLRRSVHLARCLRQLGLQPGDVLALSGKNHLQQQYPYVAALLNGLPVVGIDALYKFDEVKNVFKITEPKVAFCDPDSYEDYSKASEVLGLGTKVFTFGKGKHSIQELFDTYRDYFPVHEFEVATIDTSKIYAWLVSSGGTTGLLKFAAVTHDALKYKLESMLINIFSVAGKQDRNKPHEPALHLSSIQWISGIFNMTSMPLMNQTKLQTSAPVTPEHVIDIINKYKPVSAMMNPSLVSSILLCEKPCDLTNFRVMIITGGKAFPDTLTAFRERTSKETLVVEAYGQTENLGPILIPNPFGPLGNCGRPLPGIDIKLMDPETEKEITEPNVTGELWSKTGATFSGYYNNPEETAAAFTEDGWFRTGDLLYRDTNHNYFFVERLKMLIKYRNHHVIPPELEAVIRTHPGVADVSVTSVPHAADGEHPVACVVRRRGATVTADDIKGLVASKLSEMKQLRGGVVFLDELPYTHAGKVARGKLRKLVQTANRE